MSRVIKVGLAMVTIIGTGLLLVSSSASAAPEPRTGLVAFESDRDGDFEVFTYDPTSLELSQLTDNSGADFEPAWSPDGEWIAFESDRDGDLDIWIMDKNGDNPLRLTSSTASDIEPAWSPDGKQIAYASDEFGSYDIWVMDVDDPSSAFRVTFSPEVDTWPSWSSDGDWIAFQTTRDGNWEIYKVQLPGEAVNTAENLTNSPAEDRNPDWSPDGGWIAYDSDVEAGFNPPLGIGERHIWVMTSDAIGRRRVTGGLGLGLLYDGSDREPAWSPDGEWIFYTGNPASLGTNDDIMFIHLESELQAQAEPFQASMEQSPDVQLSFAEPGVPGLADSDCDALPDKWEVFGLRGVRDDGSMFFLDLPAMGADPEVPDIFVEIDYMEDLLDHTHKPEMDAIEMVVDAFAAAPVSPCGTGPETGVHLHVDFGADAPLTYGDAATWDAMSGADPLAHLEYLGVMFGRSYLWTNPGGPTTPFFNDLKRDNFDESRRDVFHYNLWVHHQANYVLPSGQRILPSGRSRNYSGDFGGGASDFIVSLGSFPSATDATSKPTGTVEEQAGTFMHELGHNLGLAHGGVDHVNDKPNYLSVMNYAFQMTGIPESTGTGTVDHRFDFSDAELSLFEPFLVEWLGLDLLGQGIDEGTHWYCGPTQQLDDDANQVDWDCDGGVDLLPVSADVDGDGLCVELEPDLPDTRPHPDDAVFAFTDFQGRTQRFIATGWDRDCDTPLSDVVGDDEYMGGRYPRNAFNDLGVGFQKYQRGVSSIPTGLRDDSLSTSPSDTQGIIGAGNRDEFFGMIDTQSFLGIVDGANVFNTRPLSATWRFDISGVSDLKLSLDIGAMGDFEDDEDEFRLTYSIDDGPESLAIESTIDEGGAYSYTMEGGAVVPLDDPMLVGGKVLTNEMETFSTGLFGSGDVLSVKLTTAMDGGGEAVVFQNIIIEETRWWWRDRRVAFDMVDSGSQNLLSFRPPRWRQPDVLTGHNDWANLRFDGGVIGEGAEAPLPESTDLDEMTYEEAQQLAADLSSPPPVPVTGVVAGTVRLGGEPLPDVEVWLAEGYGTDSQANRYTCTDGDGEFFFDGIAPGAPLVSAVGPSVEAGCGNGDFVDPGTGARLRVQYYDHRQVFRLADVAKLDQQALPPPTLVLDYDVLFAGNNVGMADTSQGLWHLRAPFGQWEASFYFGDPEDVPFVGDWDCDGIDTPGLFRLSDAYAYLRNSNNQGIADIRFFFGNPDDVPLAGDFNGDGCDSLSLYRPAEQRFYIINELGEDEGGLGAADFTFDFGNPGDTPFVGDFDGDGIDEVGLHRASSGFVYFENAFAPNGGGGAADVQFFFGDPGDRFVAGDWIAQGFDSPAVFRPSDETWYLKFTNTQGNADGFLTYGESPWLPVTGFWGFERSAGGD